MHNPNAGTVWVICSASGVGGLILRQLKWSSECIFKRTPGVSCQFAQEKGRGDTDKRCPLISLVQQGVTFNLPEHSLEHIDFTPNRELILAADAEMEETTNTRRNSADANSVNSDAEPGNCEWKLQA